MDQLRDKAERVGAALRASLGIAELADLEPGAPLPLSDAERAERIGERLAERFWLRGDGSWKTRFELVWPFLYVFERDSDEELYQRASEIALEYYDLREMAKSDRWVEGGAKNSAYGYPAMTEAKHRRLAELAAYLDQQSPAPCGAEEQIRRSAVADAAAPVDTTSDAGADSDIDRYDPTEGLL